MTSASQGGRDLVAITSEAVDVAAVLAHVTDPGSGAVVLFLGTTRDHSEDATGITHLEYEAYEGLVEEVIAAVVAEARHRWPLQRVAAVHRTGIVDLTGVAVAVAVSAAHRAEAFAAARHIIDELKQRAPIWKKEHWDGGGAWVREDLRHRRQKG